MKLKTSVFFAFLVGALSLSAPLPTLAQKEIAQSDELKSAIDNVSQSVEQLPNARQIALVKVFDLTLAEIKELADKDILVEAASDNEVEIAGLANFHLRTLKKDTAYINLLKRQAENDLLGLDALKTMAAEFKVWRAAYEQETKEIFDFLLFLQARAVLATANNRLDLIAADVKKLSSKTSKTDALMLTQLLSGAEKNLVAAQTSQNAAEAALLKAQADHLTAEKNPVLLKQGVGGTFTCLPSGSFLPTACLPVFRLANGYYYLLSPSVDLGKTEALKDLYQASGELLAIIPGYMDYAIIGVIEVAAVNENVDGAVLMPAALEAATEKITDEKPIPAVNENFRKAIKDEFSKISQTYSKFFFAMSKIAKKY